MSQYKILFANLGYARGIDGRLSQHVFYAYRHFYCHPKIQRRSLHQLNQLIELENPDLCCFVEIDQGSFDTAQFNQFEALINEQYPFSDIENKYAPKSLLSRLPFTAGKSNAFISKQEYDFEKLYFTCGFKRLIYKIKIAKNITIFFSHFSLNKSTRSRQILEALSLIREERGEVIFLGDFNILSGLLEIDPMLDQGHFNLLNDHSVPTFLFNKHKLLLDLCICSPTLSKRASLKVLPQPYSDHAALLLQIHF